VEHFRVIPAEAGRAGWGRWLAGLPIVENPITLRGRAWHCPPETSTVAGRLARARESGGSAALACPAAAAQQRCSWRPELAGARNESPGQLGLRPDRRPGPAPRRRGGAAAAWTAGLRGGSRDPPVLAGLIGQHRGPALAAACRQAVGADGVGRGGRLLPLARFHSARSGRLLRCYRGWLLGPQAVALAAQAALEGLAVRTLSWPLALRCAPLVAPSLVTGLQAFLAPCRWILLARLAPSPGAAPARGPWRPQPWSFGCTAPANAGCGLAGQFPCVLWFARPQWWGLIPPKLEVPARPSLPSLRRSPGCCSRLYGQRPCPFPNRFRQAAEASPLSLI